MFRHSYFISISWLLFASLGATLSRAGDIQFVENFVLAKDRAQVINQLIPGTEDYYFYRCVHLQNTQRYAEVDRLIPQWLQRHGRSAKLQEIQHRQMLLTYADHPRRTLDYLIHELRPNLNHQRDQFQSKPKLPAKLDPEKISYQTFKQTALRRHRGVQGFETRALDLLPPSELDATRRRELLSRLTRPTHPDLVELILADLQHKGSRGFGSLPIHHQLLISQLEELALHRPALENEQTFVHIYLRKLQPGPDVDWTGDSDAFGAYLNRMWDFVVRLNASHNSLKAHVLYQLLELDERLGTYDRERFLEYLALPRRAAYIQPRLLESAEARRHPVDLGLDMTGVTRLPSILNDEPLVRRYLLHFLRTDTNYQDFLPFVRDDYLRHMFAEAKITAGLGDPEKWYSLLPPDTYQALKDRVDLDFAPTNPRVFRGNDLVQLDLDIKNVSNLIVKVYEINTRNFYQQQRREVNTDIKLDGLIANHEYTYDYDEPSVIRTRRHFEFPQLQQPGVYVIDFIGNGKSSRSVVRKGQLDYVVRTDAAGHRFTIFDDRRQQVIDASLWMSGQTFDADEEGDIPVPFSTNPGRQAIVVMRGNLASLHFFDHQAEDYQFTVATHIDREALLARRDASVVLRPELCVGDEPVSLRGLTDIQVSIRSTNLDGIHAEKVYEDVVLTEARETALTFHVPDRLASIQITVRATITDGMGKDHPLSASHHMTVNQIDATEKTEQLFLTKLDDAYMLQLLGKTGEPKAHRPVRLDLRHRLFTDPMQISLATNEDGMIELGTLDDMTLVAARGPSTAETWTLWKDRITATSTIHGREGERIQVPHMFGKDGLAATEVSLYELRADSFAIDRSEAVRISDHFVELANLQGGDFSLDVAGQSYRVRLTKGPSSAGFALGHLRRLQLPRLKPLQIGSISTNDEHLNIELENVSEFSRVHVYATRFVPRFDSFSAFRAAGEVEPLSMVAPTKPSYYMAGRKLGDELQYVLLRAQARKFPGNMLQRPSLLLNAWPTRDTETSTQTPQRGEAFGAAPPAADAAQSSRDAGAIQGPVGLTDFANMDFLAEPGVAVANETPDSEGRISIPLEKFGAHHHFHVIAIDPLRTVYRSHALPTTSMPHLDLRLVKSLDPKRHFTQKKVVSTLQAGEAFELTDVATGRFDTYDNVASVYAMFATLTESETLKSFQFVTDWPSLTSEEKQDKYSEYACHELNFFLYKKDPQFFEDVVRPYITNKQHKTFLDLWLLEADLSDFLKPWAYKQLNFAERLLLGQRIAGEDEHVRRLADDLFQLLPRDVPEHNRLFETALLGRSLERGLQLGVDKRPAAGGLGFMGGGKAVEQLKRLGEKGASRRYRKSEAGIQVERELLEESLDDLAAESASRTDLNRDQAIQSEARTEFFAWQGTDRARQRLYEQLESTREWAENHYYQLPYPKQNEDLVRVNAFWRDYARHDRSQPFVSRHWPEAGDNFTEMMFALSLLDLPFAAPKHQIQTTDEQLTLKAAGPAIIFHEQIQETSSVDEDSPILLTQNFFRADDRFEMVRGQRRDKFVSDEFLTHVVYGCQVVLTNPTSTQRQVELLLQIPSGAVPINGGKATKTVTLDLVPYHTEAIDYFFYFPLAGDYSHFPAHVAEDANLLAHAKISAFHVVQEPTRRDTHSWEYVSQFATNDAVLEYLRQNNVHAIELSRIAFRMVDASYFKQILELLEERHAYESDLWAYGMKHDDRDAVATYLKHQDPFLAACGPVLDCELVQVDPVIRKTYEHFEYRPLVNARAHQLGSRRKILNDRFDQQYHGLLEVLKYRHELDHEERMALTYYLLLQDRVEEATELFASIQPSRLETQVQHDYFAAYLDCYRDQPSLAKNIVTRYVNYPVPKWQKAFANVKSLLDEIEGASVAIVDPLDRTQSQTAAAAEQPNFDFVLEGKDVLVDYQNVTELTVNFYLIDLELLFSTNPFVQQFSGQFSHVRPNLSQQIALSRDQTQHVFSLPEQLHNRNLLVEIVAGGITHSQAYFSNSLTVQLSENYGQLKVSDTRSGKAIPKTYVKVYAEMHDGRTQFYKDGYTDLRGRFDYSSLSTDNLDQVKRFSLLVLDDDRGGLVREAHVPKR